jgi:hypothetical protein
MVFLLSLLVTSQLKTSKIKVSSASIKELLGFVRRPTLLIAWIAGVHRLGFAWRTMWNRFSLIYGRSGGQLFMTPSKG